MGDSTPSTVELICPGCGAYFRLKPKKGKLPKGPIPCPKCGTSIPVEAPTPAIAQEQEETSAENQGAQTSPPKAAIMGNNAGAGIISRAKKKKRRDATGASSEEESATQDDDGAAEAEPQGSDEDRHRAALETLVDDDMGPNSTFLGFPKSNSGRRANEDKTTAIDKSILQKVRGHSASDEETTSEDEEAAHQETDEKGSTTDTSHFMREEDAQKEDASTRSTSEHQALDPNGQPPEESADDAQYMEEGEAGPFDLRDILEAEKDALGEAVSNEVTRNPALEEDGDTNYPVDLEEPEPPKPLPDDFGVHARRAPREETEEVSSDDPAIEHPVSDPQPSDEAQTVQQDIEPPPASGSSSGVLGRLKLGLAKQRMREQTNEPPKDDPASSASTRDTKENEAVAKESDAVRSTREDKTVERERVSSGDIFSEGSTASIEESSVSLSPATPERPPAAEATAEVSASPDDAEKKPPNMAALLKKKFGKRRVDSLKERVEGASEVSEVEVDPAVGDASPEPSREDPLADLLSGADEDDLAQIMDEANERSPRGKNMRAMGQLDQRTEHPHEEDEDEDRTTEMKAPGGLLGTSLGPPATSSEPTAKAPETGRRSKGNAVTSDLLNSLNPPTAAEDERARQTPNHGTDGTEEGPPGITESSSPSDAADGDSSTPPPINWGDNPPKRSQRKFRRQRQDSHSGLFPLAGGLNNESSVGMAGERRGSGYIRLPTAEILEVLGQGQYRLKVEDIVYEPVDEQGLTELIKRGVLMGAELIAEQGGEFMPIGEHPVFKRLRKKMAMEAHALLAKYRRANEEAQAERERERIEAQKKEAHKEEDSLEEASEAPPPFKGKTLPLSALSSASHAEALAESSSDEAQEEGVVDLSAEVELDLDEQEAEVPAATPDEPGLPVPVDDSEDLPVAASEADYPTVEEEPLPSGPEASISFELPAVKDEDLPAEDDEVASDISPQVDEEAPVAFDDASAADDYADDIIEPESPFDDTAQLESDAAHAPLPAAHEASSAEEQPEPLEESLSADPLAKLSTSSRSPLLIALVVALLGIALIAGAFVTNPSLLEPILGSAEDNAEGAVADKEDAQQTTAAAQAPGAANAVEAAKASLGKALVIDFADTDLQRGVASELLSDGEAERAANIYAIGWTPSSPRDVTTSYARALQQIQRWDVLRHVATVGMQAHEDSEIFAKMRDEAIAKDPMMRGMTPIEVNTQVHGDRMEAVQVGKAIAFKLSDEDGAMWSFKPQQRAYSDAEWRHDVVAWRLCELIDCPFILPETVPARLDEATFNRLLDRGQGAGASSPSDRYGNLAWQTKEREGGGRARYLEGTLKRWVPQGTYWNMDYTGTWRPLLTATEDPALLDAPLAETLDGVKDEAPKMYEGLIAQKDALDTRTFARQLSSVVLFDYLTNHMDRFSERPAYSGLDNQFRDGRFVSLDHSNTFAARISSRVEGRFGWVSRYPVSLVERIRTLDREQADAILFGQGSRINAAERGAFWERHRELLKEVDRQIRDHGEENVLTFE